MEPQVDLVSVMNSKGWFSEVNDLWPGQSFSLKVKRVLHEETSKYQNIKLLDTETFGRTLVLDDIIQCTERDEFSYQEMISFLPLCCHPSPKKVLIVGGGDGGVAREVVKHPLVEEVYQVEIDDRVVELSKQYLPFMACGFDHPKVRLQIGDGFEFMKQHRGEFDVIITDSSDPVGPAVSLFQEPYFQLLRNALRDENGIVCSQGGCYWTDLTTLKETLAHCLNIFPVATYAYSAIPSYPCGLLGYIICANRPGANVKEPCHTFTDAEIDAMQMRYYSSAMHRAAFVLPRYLEKELP